MVHAASTICDCEVKSDVIICACDGQNCASSGIDANNCAPSITIDGTQTDSAKGEQHRDGILIRSNHDIVRGVKIINFTRAGIAIDPVCQSDIVGHNRVEGNTLENNKVAGVLVLDAPSNQANAVVHNVGNTILGNTILGNAVSDSLVSVAPIDLGGDGRTNNDLCDIDQGPNTLLNFPYKVTATMSASGVTVMGTVCDPNCATEVCQANLTGAVVEVFGITRYGTNSASQATSGLIDIQSDADNRVITGVIPLARGTTGADGSFSISGVPLSPTCGYTATVTDTKGSTSELMFPCAGFANAEIMPKTIAFDAVAARRKPRKERKQPSRTFTIENTGCAQLDLAATIRRTGDDVTSRKITDPDDSKLFSVSAINPDGIETAIGPNTTISIPQGQRVTFRVRFNPVIPHVVDRPPPLSANEVLPNVITSELNLNHNGCGDSTVTLKAGVEEGVHLINPIDPGLSALVTLARSGDEFIVTYFIFDSRLGDIQSVDYRFFKQGGKEAVAEITDHDLTQPIKERMLVNGQSIRVVQTFSNATQNPKVTTVEVTVHGSNSVDTATGRLGGQNAASVRSVRGALNAPLILPSVKLLPPVHKSAPRSRKIAGSGAPQVSKERAHGRRNNNAKT